MSANLSIGVDVGGTKILAVVLDEAGGVLDQERVPTPRGEDEIVDAVTSVAETLCDRCAVDGRPAPLYVGVGIPGLVDRDGVTHHPPNNPGVERIELRARLQKYFGYRLQVRVDNDANCLAWAERRFGGGENAQHVLVINLGTGLGGGLIVDGELERGATGFAGEVGHMVLDRYGPPCGCGQRGCWERFASGSGLARLAREAAYANSESRAVELAGGDPADVKGEHITQAALEGDELAIGVIAEFTTWLAIGLVNLTNIFDPERIVLGGGVIGSGEVFLDLTRKAFSELLFGVEYRKPIPIVAAALGERAGAIGAADLART